MIKGIHIYIIQTYIHICIYILKKEKRKENTCSQWKFIIKNDDDNVPFILSAKEIDISCLLASHPHQTPLVLVFMCLCYLEWFVECEPKGYCGFVELCYVHESLYLSMMWETDMTTIRHPHIMRWIEGRLMIIIKIVQYNRRESYT